MRKVWLTVTLVVISLSISLLGVYKDAFLPEEIPSWFFFVTAILPTIAAALKIYQDVKSIQIEKGVNNLSADITPQSEPKAFTPEQQMLRQSLVRKVSKIHPGESKLFVAPHVSSKTFYNLALIAFNQRDFVQAEKYLKNALKADDKNLDAFNLLLQLYQSAAMNHLQDREQEAAALSLNKAVQLMDSAPAGINLRTAVLIGYLSKSLGQVYAKTDSKKSEQYWEEAEKIFKQVLVSNKNDPGALNGIGNFLLHKGRFREALQSSEQALKVAPHYTAAANDAAIVCENLMKQDPPKREDWKTKAIGYFELAIKLSKTDPQFPTDYESGIRNYMARKGLTTD